MDSHEAPRGASGLPAGVLDLRPLKATACRVLPPGHPLRVAIMRESDFVQGPAAWAKLETYFALAEALDTK